MRVTVSSVRKENLQLRAQNERYQRRTEEVLRAWKWDQCRKLAMNMLAKGSFLTDPKTNKERPKPDQRKLAYDEARKLMRLTNDEIESRMEFVGSLPNARTLVPRWKKEIPRPHPQAVKRAGAQSSPTAREDLDESLFIDDEKRGF
jgi:hypothetical protein